MRVKSLDDIMQDTQLQAKSTALLYEGKPEEAIKYCDSLIAQNPKSPQGYSARFNIYLELDMLNEALEDAQTAIELGDEDPDKIEFLAHEFFNLGQFEKAIKNYDKYLEEFPEDDYAWKNKVYAHMQLIQIEEAEKAYAQYAKVAPLELLLASNISKDLVFLEEELPALLENNNLDNALEFAQSFTQKYPLIPEGYMHKGIVHLNRGERKEALRDFEKVIASGLKTKYQVYIAGIYHSLKGEPEEALSYFNQILDGSQFDLAVNNNIAALHLKTGDFKTLSEHIGQYVDGAVNLASLNILTEASIVGKNPKLFHALQKLRYNTINEIQAIEASAKGSIQPPNFSFGDVYSRELERAEKEQLTLDVEPIFNLSKGDVFSKEVH